MARIVVWLLSIICILYQHTVIQGVATKQDFLSSNKAHTIENNVDEYFMNFKHLHIKQVKKNLASFCAVVYP